MSNGKYKSKKFNRVDIDPLRQSFEGETLVVTTDVAKVGMYSGLGDSSGTVDEIVRWNNSDQLEEFADWIDSLGADHVQLVIEPTGTYGDPLRHMAFERGWEVFLVSPKRLHDAAEVFDGVPSLHDAKAATLLAKLHAEGLSQPWGAQDADERILAAAIRTMVRYDDFKRRNMGRLEAELARYWPEVECILKKDSATLLALLVEFKGPEGVAREPARARELMKKASRSSLSSAKIQATIDTAEATVGQPMLEMEKRMLADLARHTDELRQRGRLWRRVVEDAIKGLEGVEELGEVIGEATAAVFRSSIGDFRDFDSPEALLKMFGINLKEKSSGKYKGQLKFTKRGPSEARRYLYWATLRMIRLNPVFRAWHKKKIGRDGGLKMKSIGALMRKLVKGLWHVARGETFDATKLFDTSKLALNA